MYPTVCRDPELADEDPADLELAREVPPDLELACEVPPDLELARELPSDFKLESDWRRWTSTASAMMSGIGFCLDLEVEIVIVAFETSTCLSPSSRSSSSSCMPVLKIDNRFLKKPMLMLCIIIPVRVILAHRAREYGRRMPGDFDEPRRRSTGCVSCSSHAHAPIDVADELLSSFERVCTSDQLASLGRIVPPLNCGRPVQRQPRAGCRGRVSRAERNDRTCGRQGGQQDALDDVLEHAHALLKAGDTNI